MRIIGAIVLAAAIVAGCSKTRSDVRASAGTATTGTVQASEGTCKEHGVLEAVCPKCNPALAAVFKAKGDWCQAHGFPESFCPACHPERGGKPASDVADDGAPPDGTKIRFKRKDTAKLAGIETVKANLRPGGASIVATARLAYDATKLAHLNARSPGVVRSLKVDVGTKVKKGDALLVIDSPNVGADRARLRSARARIGVAEENHRRLVQLEAEGVAAKKDVLVAGQELEEARGEHAALSAALSVTGASAGGVGGYTLTAPISGVVTERTATIGKLVQADQILLEIVDTSSVWAELDVPEADISKVTLGQLVTLTFDGLPQREFGGKIDYIAPAVDPHTRTTRARVSIPNPDAVLRAQMFGQARIAVESEHPVVLVPRAAIQRAGDVHLAFVRLAEDQFETRRVTLGIQEREHVEVTKGVEPGEAVATVGSFLLKTETLKGSIGAGCCEVD